MLAPPCSRRPRRWFAGSSRNRAGPRTPPRPRNRHVEFEGREQPDHRRYPIAGDRRNRSGAPARRRAQVKADLFRRLPPAVSRRGIAGSARPPGNGSGRRDRAGDVRRVKSTLRSSAAHHRDQHRAGRISRSARKSAVADRDRFHAARHRETVTEPAFGNSRRLRCVDEHGKETLRPSQSSFYPSRARTTRSRCDGP
jgi:hypothetical protein